MQFWVLPRWQLSGKGERNKLYTRVTVYHERRPDGKKEWQVLLTDLKREKGRRLWRHYHERGGTIEEYNDQSERAYHLEVVRTGHFDGLNALHSLIGLCWNLTPVDAGGIAAAAGAVAGGGAGVVGGGGATGPGSGAGACGAQRPAAGSGQPRSGLGGARHGQHRRERRLVSLVETADPTSPPSNRVIAQLRGSILADHKMPTSRQHICRE